MRNQTNILNITIEVNFKRRNICKGVTVHDSDLMVLNKRGYEVSKYRITKTNRGHFELMEFSVSLDEYNIQGLTVVDNRLKDVVEELNNTVNWEYLKEVESEIKAWFPYEKQGGRKIADIIDEQKEFRDSEYGLELIIERLEDETFVSKELLKKLFEICKMNEFHEEMFYKFIEEKGIEIEEDVTIQPLSTVGSDNIWNSVKSNITLAVRNKYVEPIVNRWVLPNVVIIHSRAYGYKFSKSDIDKHYISYGKNEIEDMGIEEYIVEELAKDSINTRWTRRFK